MVYSLIGIVLAFAGGILVAPFFAVDPLILWAAAATCLLLSLLGMRFRRLFLVGILIAVGLLGILRYQTAQLPFAQLYNRAGTLREVSGTVRSYPTIGVGRTAFTFQPDQIQGMIRVTIFWEGGERPMLFYGDRLRLTGSIRAPRRFRDFDYRAFLARQGIFATMAIGDDDAVDLLGVGGSRLLRRGDILRQRLLARLDLILPPQEAGLAHGLLFGERATLDEEIEEAFRRTGLMHLLAVSGLHLGIFLVGLWFILRRIGLRPIFTYPLVGIAILLVLWIVGPRISLVRAALLFAFLALGSVLADLGLILRRWVRPYNGLAAAALVILALRPPALHDIGFQLSFGATAAILFVFNPTLRVQAGINTLAERLPLPTWSIRYPLSLLAVSAAAQAGAVPFIAYHFATIHPLSLAGNLIAVPLATIALWLGILTLFFSFPPLIGPLGVLFSLALRALIGLVEQLGRLPGAEIYTPPWMGVWIGGIVCYFFLVATIRALSFGGFQRRSSGLRD